MRCGASLVPFPFTDKPAGRQRRAIQVRSSRTLKRNGRPRCFARGVLSCSVVAIFNAQATFAADAKNDHQ